MKSGHLSETQLQAYVADSNGADPTVSAHIHSCVLCSTAAANYRLVLDTLSAADKPVFDFDLSASVLALLPPAPVTKPAFPWLQVLAAGLSMLLLGVILFYSGSLLLRLAKGIPGMGLGLIGVAALMILIFQVAEMYRRHHRQMKTLKFL